MQFIKKAVIVANVFLLANVLQADTIGSFTDSGVESTGTQAAYQSAGEKRLNRSALRLTGPVYHKNTVTSPGWQCTAVKSTNIDLLVNSLATSRVTAILNNALSLTGKVTPRNVLRLANKHRLNDVNQPGVAARKVSFAIKQTSASSLLVKMSIVLFGVNGAKGCKFNFSNTFVKK